MKVTDKTIRPNSQAAGPPAERRQVQWEYEQRQMPRNADLNGFGADGWECYHVVSHVDDTATFYFKRRR